MSVSWIIDQGLIKRAVQSESVQLVDGRDNEGNRILVIVATGSTAGLLLEKLREHNILIPEAPSSPNL